MIVVTSDESLGNALARTDPDLEIWAWSESLHIGRIPAGNDLKAFSKDRARLFQEWGWDECREVEGDWNLRNDALIQAIERGESIVLLFGSGIRDQLTLSRISAWLAGQASDALGKIRLLNVDSPLSERSTAWLVKALASAPNAGMQAIRQYESVWNAFVSDDPRLLERCYHSYGDGPLQESLGRLLREYPSSENGVSLTECQILDIVSLGVRAPIDVFERFRETESPPFLIDWEFWLILERMASGSCPLIDLEGGADFIRPPKGLAWKEFHDQELRLTSTGERILEGRCNYAELDFPERWLGGVRIAKDNMWFWSYETMELTQDARLAGAE